jgi:hypothetical protein
MYLRLKENHTFTEEKTGVSKIATPEDYPIARIYDLSIASQGEGFSGSFYLNFFWQYQHEFPFYTKFIQLPVEVIEVYKTITIPEGVTEIDIAKTIQTLVYNYLLTLFPDWELSGS